MASLRHDGWRIIAEGRTTPEEVLRATKEESTAWEARADDVELAAAGGVR